VTLLAQAAAPIFPLLFRDIRTEVVLAIGLDIIGCETFLPSSLSRDTLPLDAKNIPFHMLREPPGPWICNKGNPNDSSTGGERSPVPILGDLAFERF
jgi:hypothetical protein